MMAVTTESLQAAQDYALSKMARRPDGPRHCGHGAMPPVVAAGTASAARVAYADVQSNPKWSCALMVCAKGQGGRAVGGCQYDTHVNQASFIRCGGGGWGR